MIGMATSLGCACVVAIVVAAIVASVVVVGTNCRGMLVVVVAITVVGISAISVYANMTMQSCF